MEIQAKAPKKKCLIQVVRSMTIKTDETAQQEFLAILYAAFIDGGEIIVNSFGSEGKQKRSARLSTPGIGYFYKSKPETTNEQNHTTTRT